MKRVEKYNEFIDRKEEKIIMDLIKESESTPSSNLVEISQRKPYREIISMGKKVIPYLLERKTILWDIGLKELTGCGLESHEYDTSKRTQYWIKWAKEHGYEK